MPNAHDLQHQRLDNGIAAVYDLVAKLDRRQLRHEQRFEQFATDTTARLDGIDGRLDGIDGRLDEVTGTLAVVVDLLGGRSARD